MKDRKMRKVRFRPNRQQYLVCTNSQNKCYSAVCFENNKIVSQHSTGILIYYTQIFYTLAFNTHKTKISHETNDDVDTEKVNCELIPVRLGLRLNAKNTTQNRTMSKYYYLKRATVRMQ